MNTTHELIEKCLFSILGDYNYLNLRLYDYSLNGSIIKINYNYRYDDKYNDTSYDNILEIELLDYISFLFNFFFARNLLTTSKSTLHLI